MRQLENTCNWLTVMAPGREVHIEDLPAELRDGAEEQVADWQTALAAWAEQQLRQGDSAILKQAAPAFEATLIRAALRHTGGRKRDAANLLGLGRNTLARKLGELGLAK